MYAKGDKINNKDEKLTSEEEDDYVDTRNEIKKTRRNKFY